MRAAWCEKQGQAADVLVVGEMPDPHPQAGEVRIRVRASGVNPSEIKKRQGWLGSPMPYPRIVPHSDGAGEIDAVGVELPYWPLAFQNVVIRLLASDDFPQEAKRQAAADLVSCLEAGALRTEIRQVFPLNRIADAHRAVENPTGSGRVVLEVI